MPVDSQGHLHEDFNFLVASALREVAQVALPTLVRMLVDTDPSVDCVLSLEFEKVRVASSSAAFQVHSTEAHVGGSHDDVAHIR
jgi:hypothetical protein